MLEDFLSIFIFLKICFTFSLLIMYFYKLLLLKDCLRRSGDDENKLEVDFWYENSAARLWIELLVIPQ